MLTCPACSGTRNSDLGGGWYVCRSQVVIGATAPVYLAHSGHPVYGDCGRQFTVAESEAVELARASAEDRAADRNRQLAAREPGSADLAGQIALERRLGRHEKDERSELIMSQQISIPLAGPDGEEIAGSSPAELGVNMILSVLEQAASIVEPRDLMVPGESRTDGGLFRRGRSREVGRTVRGWIFPINYSHNDPRPAYSRIIGVALTERGAPFLVERHRPSERASGIAAIRELAPPHSVSSGGALERDLPGGSDERDVERWVVLHARQFGRVVGSFIADQAALKSRVGLDIDGVHWLDRDVPLVCAVGRDWSAVVDELPALVEIPSGIQGA